jgi:branched-chain amino acid aminotransferase
MMTTTPFQSIFAAHKPEEAAMAEQSIYGGGGIGFMDGEFMPMSEIRLPVTDMGFQLSDMCYDAIHAWKGRFFRLDEHLDRWERSLASNRYTTIAFDRDQVAEVLHSCVARADLQDSMVTFVCTRGTPSSGHKDLRTCQNRFIAWALPYYGCVPADEIENGCDIVVADTIRIPASSVDPTVKNFGRLDFMKALFEAYDRDALYAVLLDNEGHVTEGRGWNIFSLTGGVLTSPDSGALEGITRKTVYHLSEKLNIEAKEGRIEADELRAADEIFITSTAGGIMPVKSIDGNAIGDGQPGPVTMRIRDLYWGLHDDPDYSTPVNYDTADA